MNAWPTPTHLSAADTPMVVAFDKMPPQVTDAITQLGGYFAFIVNALAIIHLVFLGGSIAVERLTNRQMPAPPGEWFTKIVFGVWITAAATDIAAAVMFAT